MFIFQSLFYGKNKYEDNSAKSIKRITVSKRHHYIPQFYLKGFTNELGEYYLFDKEKNEIRKSKPINSFFENKRNMAFVKDEEFVLLEDMYARYDGRTAQYIDELKNMTKQNFTLKPDTLAYLKIFIPQLFGRIPINDVILDVLIDNSSFKEMRFDFLDKVGTRQCQLKITFPCNYIPIRIAKSYCGRQIRLWSKTFA